ncbi:MAG TPA: dihydrodipicolinate synthase family protein, partial [Eubacteriales bacterium]|nr:dihydrodipicolinate synthase family protein [Eubacteriales bacterium]
DIKKARDMQLKVLPLVKAIFSEVNPIPIKKAAEIIGLCSGILRLPLTEMQPENTEVLKKILAEF